MTLTLAQVEELAPDQGSLAAARALLAPAKWPVLAADGAGLVWGECQGSGSQPYRVMLAEADLGYKCTCPSRKFPCKHTLALMWMRAQGRPFATEERPGWVNDWLSRRRGGSARPKPAAPPDAPSAPRSIADLPEPVEQTVDPRLQARATAQRERSRAEREATILAGLEELDQWIADQLERGLAGFAPTASEQCRVIARRLVDAKAGGLASRLEQLPAALFSLPEHERTELLIERLGELHLIAEAYRRQSELAPPLRADVRLTVGWTMSRDELLDDPMALRCKRCWMVVASFSEIQPDKLRRIETWLTALDGDERAAVLIDFFPVSAGSVDSYAPGEAFEAELAFYPSAAPMRAIIAERSGPAVAERWPSPSLDLTSAIEHYESALAARPWLGPWPLAVRDVAVMRGPSGLHLTDARAGLALPIAPRDDQMLPLVGLQDIDAFGVWDGRRLQLSLAETSLGRWMAT